MKLAFVHDWFNANGGAEKVAGEILDIYKKDDVTIYALFNKFSSTDRNIILKKNNVKVSLLQYIPFISRIYRYFLPVMPWLMKRFNLKDYDVIISSSHAVAKGFRSDPEILNICYCHTPLRPIWDMYDDYALTHSLGRSFLYKGFVDYLRKWDKMSANHVHHFIANSIHIQKRIEVSYNRKAIVIYPPVNIDKFELSEELRGDYYLCLGRFVPYKKIDMIIRAFMQMPDKKLVLVGDGWGAKKFNSMLRQSGNIDWLGYKQDGEMIKLIQRAKACVFAAKEDFGIMCVEVQACGTPVLALNYGGYKETVIDGVTGYLFPEQTEQSIIATVNKFEEVPLTDHVLIRQNSLRFSTQRFRSEFTGFVQNAISEFYDRK